MRAGGARHQRGRRALREPGGEKFFVGVAQAAWAVHHQHAGVLGALQQVGGVDILHVERRVLAHQDDIEFGQRPRGFLAPLEPAPGVVEHLEFALPCQGLPVAQKQVALFHVADRPAARLRLEQHGERAVLVSLDGTDGVHHHAEFDHL